MKVILLRDIAKLGKKFDIVNIPDGYAQNKLIPNKDVEPATPANLKKIQKQKDKTKENREGQEAEIKDIADNFKTEPLEIPMDVNEVDNLFRSVSTSDVTTAGKERGVNIPEGYIKFTEPIKTTGAHKIELVGHDVVYELPIVVVNKK